jgi:CDP-diacylglycerol--serine O-phosphatidyltransferase
MKQLYVLPNIITAFGLACGLFVIFKVNMVEMEGGSYQLLFYSSVLILIAALADVLDGAIARIMGAESDFGVMFDSLADAVSFGVAPSVLFLKTLSLELGTPLSFFAFFTALVFSICGILRLVRYNVSASQIKDDQIATAAFKKNFTGLPIPAGAGCVISLNLLFHSHYVEDYFRLSQLALTLILGGANLFIGCLMISRCKFFSLKAFRIKTDSLYLIFFTMIFTMLILYGMIHHFSFVFFFLFWSYLTTGCVLTLLRLIAGRKAKHLKDFDPDDEDTSIQ